MSRRINKAELALTTSGKILLNVAPLDEDLDSAALLKLAMAQRGDLFIGVVLSPAEVEGLIKDVELVLPNVTMPLVGRRLRQRG